MDLETRERAVEGADVMIEEALEKANFSVLRLALYLATQDAELADMKVNEVPVRGGAFSAYQVDEAHIPVIKQKARDFLVGGGAESATSTPSDELLREAMNLMTGRPVNDREFRLGREELAIDEVPRAARWTNGRPAAADDFHVVIVGAGASEIGRASW